MYTITPHTDGSFTVHLPNAQALTHLLGRHSKANEYISNAEAHSLALEHGIELPRTTLISACQRGTIPGAQKQRGRWRVPRTAFLTWLNKDEPDPDKSDSGESDSGAEESSLWKGKTH